MEPYIINQTGDQLQSILNKAIIKAELQTTEDGNQAIRFTASDGTSISVALPEWSKRIEYLLQNTYYLQEGIGCAAFDYKMSLGGVTIQSGEVTRQDGDSIILDTSANRFVLERKGKFYTKFASGGANLQGSDVYASSLQTFLNRQDTSYWYRKEDGTLAQGSSTFVIRNWLKTLQSECDSTQEAAETARTSAQEAKAKADAAQEAANTAQQTAAAAQTKNADQDTRIAALLQGIPWEGYHMNAFTDTGEYHIHGESTDENDGMPILNAGTIDARLTVLDSSLTRGTGEKTDTVVTQILRLSNRMGGDGHVYVRTAQAATKSQLATPSSTAWSTWEKLMGMFEKNAVTNIADLNTYTTNGMYSGLFADTTLQTLGGLQFTPGDTFLLITVNGYAASAFGTPQLTQMLYRLPAKKGSGNSSARMYLRTAYWNKDAEPKAWVWANWDRLAMASEISGGGGGNIEEYNRLIELIAANTEKISSVESTANAAKSAAETAQTAANTAQETANSARETATAASTAAQEAQTTATNASENAEQAKNLANQAKATAEEIDGKANDAISKATEASDKASDAETAAIAAQNTADSYSSKITILNDKVKTLNGACFGGEVECFNFIPVAAYNNLSSVIPAGTKYHIHFPEDKALYEYYEGGSTYTTIRKSGSDDVDVIAGGNVNRIYVSSVHPAPSVNMVVTYNKTDGALYEIEGLKEKTKELEEKVNSTDTGSNLFIGSLYNDGVKRKMVSLCAVPYHGCSLAFSLPEGVSAGIISGVSNDSITDAGVVLSNGATFTFNIAHNYYRLYFTGESLDTINTYIADGDISVTFDAENNIVSDQQGCDSYIKSICYNFTSNYANNKMYSMPILCHISDTHGDAMRMKRCVKFCEYLGGVDAVLHSGDAVAWNNTSKMTYIDDVAKDSSIVVLPCIGNHEAMSATAQDLYDNMSYLMTKNNVIIDSNTDVPTYYYKDITDKKIRIIVLNQFFADGRHYTQDELNFFVNALLTTQNEYGVIVMAHSPEGRPTRDNNHSAFYRDVTVGEGFVYLVDYAKPIQEIVDAFISRVTLTKSYTQKYGNEAETLTVNADFTNIDSSVEFIAHITGHEHEDCIGYNAETTNKQLMLNITCGVGIMGGSVELSNDSDLGRDGKGQSQDAFNIYAIDRVNGTVRIARVGANINNQMKERKYMIIPYKD